MKVNVDFDLLEEQQRCLLRLIDEHPFTVEDVELLDGVINMIDALFDERDLRGGQP